MLAQGRRANNMRNKEGKGSMLISTPRPSFNNPDCREVVGAVSYAAKEPLARPRAPAASRPASTSMQTRTIPIVFVNLADPVASGIGRRHPC